jgi:hypothetical protein
VDEHWWNVGIAVGTVFLTIAFTWMANCISNSTNQNIKSREQVNKLEYAVADLVEDTKRLERIIEKMADQLSTFSRTH